MSTLARLVKDCIAAAGAHPALAKHAADLANAVDLLDNTTKTLQAAGARGEVRLFLANSHVYMEMFGHVLIAWQWLRQANAAAALIAACTTVGCSLAVTSWMVPPVCRLAVLRTVR